MLPYLVDDLELEKDFPSPPLDLRFVPVERLNDGVRVKVLEPKLANSEELAKFDARDFQLQEILESGSYDLLSPVRPITLDRLSSLDAAERASSDLDSYLDKISVNTDDVVAEPKSTEGV